MSNELLKRAFDFSVALTTLLLFSPVILVVAILVRINLGSPVLFRQTRPGFKGRPFKLMKFRTMLDATDSEGKPLPDDVRLTRFGKLLRKTSLDELPSLINILKGEMSLVGPRPLLMQYLELYTPEENRRHDVLPGLTGWAQVNGRNNIGWPEKLRLDVEYVDQRSFFMDLKIILMTFTKILSADGVSKDGHATTEVFTGSNQHE